MLELVDLVTVLLDALKSVPVLLNMTALFVRKTKQGLVFRGPKIALLLHFVEVINQLAALLLQLGSLLPCPAKP